MITIYRKDENGIHAEPFALASPIPDGTLWIDMQSPSREEEMILERQLGIEIPTKEETWKNQVLNRLYQEDNVSYMTAAIITKADCPYPQTSSVTLILAPRYLLTLRYIDPTSFKHFAQRIQRSPQKFANAAEVLEGLLEEIITRVAHNSEVVVETLDQLSHGIFNADIFSGKGSNSSTLLKDVLKKLGTCADLNLKINESLHSISRILSFFKKVNPAGTEVDNNISILMTDAQALTHQTAFLSDKITFQLDATLGMINVEQNLIIKLFSVVAVFFLPPTLISSMYGMNFQDMPELHWNYGYPFAIVLMMLCAVVPYVYFRKKGWL